MAVDWVRIHTSRSVSLLTPPLALCSLFYGLGLRVVEARQRKRDRRSLPGFVVSIGNLTVGGAGKTPAVAALAGWAMGKGYRVAVLSRGYGSRQGRGVRMISDGSRVMSGLADSGDEPLMLAGQLTGVPVFVCRDRYRAGRAAHMETGADFFVLDDGFQHRSLKRDLDIVLLDACEPVGNGHLLPWGPLRESVEALHRAHAVVMTRVPPEGEARGPGETIMSRFPGIPCFRSTHVPSGVFLSGGGGIRPPSVLKGRRVSAFCGIAKPDAFRGTLAGLGAEVAVFERFRDHHPFTREEVDRLVRRHRAGGADFLLTTEKDWMRAGPFLEGVEGAGFVRVEFRFLDQADAFFDMVRERAAEAGVFGKARNPVRVSGALEDTGAGT